MNKLEYNGFTGSVEYCELSEVWHGKILDTEHLITYESDRIDNLEPEFKESVDLLWDIYTKEAYENIEKDEEARYKNDQKVLSRVKKMVKPKVFQDIEWEMKEHMWCGDFSIVDVSDCVGERRTYSDYKGCSSPIRTVYDNTSYDSYCDSYGGDMYISLGKGKYLKMSLGG